jgi:hypothetical protein
MKNDKAKAIELRRKGKSYTEIIARLGVPKSTLSDWFKGSVWSEVLRAKLSKKASLSHPKKLKKVIAANKLGSRIPCPEKRSPLSGWPDAVLGRRRQITPNPAS